MIATICYWASNASGDEQFKGARRRLGRHCVPGLDRSATEKGFVRELHCISDQFAKAIAYRKRHFVKHHNLGSLQNRFYFR